MDNIYNMANRKRHLTKDIAYYNKSKFQMQTLFWYPFNSLNFSNRNKEIFDD